MSLRLKGAILRHLAGWSGGVLEGAEPDLADRSPYGSLAGGLNVQTGPLGRLNVRGGSRVLLTFALGAIDEVLGVWPWSPTGALAIAYDGTANKHYAYALTDTMAFAFVNEAGSRIELTAWAGNLGNPVAVELFETMYVSDATTGNNYPLQAITSTGAALAVATPQYDLDGNGLADATPFTLAVYNSALFLAGWLDDTTPEAPHILRNSLIGTSPSLPGGIDVDAYATIGAQGQRILAMEPGRDILLVAKSGELYRIFGTGQALPGWFYGIQQLENTKGYGARNPNALKHVNGYWYGIGKAGPWRTDGTRIDPLGIPWRESWARVDSLDSAWVQYHPEPDKRKVWFGFHEAGAAVATVPNTIWPWDLDRETWSPPQRYPRSFRMVGLIIPGTTDAPSGAPATIEQRFTNGDFEYAAASLRWVSADLDASTEIWGRSGNDPYTLQATVPAGIQRARLPIPAATRFPVKLRHVKGGTASEFSGVTTLVPVLPSPGISLSGAAGYPPQSIIATISNPLAGSEITTSDTNSSFSDVQSNLPVGGYSLTGLDKASCVSVVVPDSGATIQTQLSHPSWPVGHDVSRIEEMVSLEVGCTTFAQDTGPTVRQSLENGGMQPTSITVRYHPHAYTRIYRLQYKLASSSTWITHSDFAQTTFIPHTTVSVTITGLVASAHYHVRVALLDSQSLATLTPGATVDCFTTLAVPGQTVVSIGSPGLPHVRITLTAPYATASIASYDQRETHSQVYTPGSTAPVNHDVVVGTCGRPNRFTARTYDATWPAGYQFSDPVMNELADPCL